MTFRILDASHPLDRAAWQEALSKLPASQRDLHFEPGYVAAYAAEIGAHALCALQSYNDNDFVLYPFVLKSTKEIACAYGYGGHVFSNPVGRLFLDDFRYWRIQNRIIREFYRCHPFVTHIRDEGPAEKQIVYMDLSLDPETELRKGHKSSLNLARGAGVTVEPSDDLELFRDMYLQTMSRKHAQKRWEFSENLLPALKDAYPDGFRFMLAKVHGEPEAGCILLGAHQTCYYHYAGSYGCHRYIGVGQAIVVEAAKWAKLHLGGATTADPKDPLFIFKSGFSKQRAWVYKYEREFKQFSTIGTV